LPFRGRYPEKTVKRVPVFFQKGNNNLSRVLTGIFDPTISRLYLLCFRAPGGNTWACSARRIPSGGGIFVPAILRTML
jgi:hypothetical protein